MAQLPVSAVREEGGVEVEGERALGHAQRLHARGELGGALLDEGAHDHAGALDYGQRRVLEELVEDAAVGGDHFEQGVEVVAVRCFGEGRTEGVGEEVEQGRYDQGACAVFLVVWKGVYDFMG